MALCATVPMCSFMQEHVSVLAVGLWRMEKGKDMKAKKERRDVHSLIKSQHLVQDTWIK